MPLPVNLVILAVTPYIQKNNPTFCIPRCKANNGKKVKTTPRQKVLLIEVNTENNTPVDLQQLKKLCLKPIDSLE